MRYALRDLSREDAARAAGVPINTLDVWVHRYHVGGKRGSARLFSPRDVAIIANARKLERAGLAVPEALRVLEQALHDPPEADTILVIEDGQPRRVRGDFNLAASNAESVTCLWIGHIADHVISKLEAPRVAIQN
ncbi:MerR family transcriptional regulator [Mesorhizobium yinganensis]|uniref:MerR family transcriptional regulator n=1 Tax=Mesorhizobium yinganensis TaxID=3157707 RepID=UPI0032B827E3